MHDELSAPPTTDDPSDDRRVRDDESPATEPASTRSRDGVDPPDEGADRPADGDATGSPELGDDRDEDDCDGDDEAEPLEYRLERLRLWRAPATLAGAGARLIRSL
jgi:hypothetical protein